MSLPGRELRLACVLMTVLGCLLPSASFAADLESAPAGIDESVANGLAFLARAQSPDGSFGGNTNRPADTGLTLLAFLSCGDAPDTGRYGLVVRDAINWLVLRQKPDGRFAVSHRQEFTQAVTSLALAEAYGVDPNPDRRAQIHVALVKAIRIILEPEPSAASQPAGTGGRPATARSSRDSIALIAWKIMALRAAADTGITIPQEAFASDAALNLGRYDPKTGGFADYPGAPTRVGGTAAAMICLYLSGQADQNAGKLDAAARYLRIHPVDANAPFAYHADWYAALATFQHGSRAWSLVGRNVLASLIKRRQPDGGWNAGHDSRAPDRIDATAMAVMTLAIPYRLLPIEQR